MQQIAEKAELPLTLSSNVFDFTCLVQERFADGDSKVKKAILATIGSNLILKDKKLLIEATKPFVLLAGGLDSEQPGNCAVEPENNDSPQQENAYLEWAYPLRLALVDEGRTSHNKINNLATRMYHYFRNVCESPAFKLSDWWHLNHLDDDTHWKN